MITLKELELKPEALNSLPFLVALPVVLRRGYIGSVELRINSWANPGLKPVLNIDEVYILLAIKYDWTPEEQRQRWKLADSARINEARQYQEEAAKQGSEDAAKSQGFFGRMITSVLDNLQVHFGGVHIRLEDHVSNPERPFALGVTLQSLHVQVSLHTRTCGMSRPKYAHRVPAPCCRLVSVH